jgi:excisionase family DNA binding protein
MSIQSEKTMWKNELLTVKEVAVHLRLSRVTVWRWCQQGIIPAVRVGRNWRIHRDELLYLSESQYPKPESINPSQSLEI